MLIPKMHLGWSYPAPYIILWYVGYNSNLQSSKTHQKYSGKIIVNLNSIRCLRVWLDFWSFFLVNVYYTTTFEYPMLLPPPNNFDRHSDISVTTQKSGSIQPPQKASGQILLSFFPSIWLSDGSLVTKARVLEVFPKKASTRSFSSFSDKIWAYYLMIFWEHRWCESLNNIKKLANNLTSGTWSVTNFDKEIF